MGKPRMDRSGRWTIIAFFLRFPDKKRVLIVDVNLKVRITRCLRTSPKDYMN